MVDTFETKYKALAIPYPGDQVIYQQKLLFFLLPHEIELTLF